MITSEPEASTEAVALAAEIRVIFGRLKRRFRAEGGSAELTPSQASALGALEKLGPSTVTELAQAEGVRPQSMGATIATLEAAGFVVSTPDPGDGRRRILSLSPMAIGTFTAHRAAREGWLVHAIQTELTPREQRELARGFALLDRLVQS